MERRLPHNYYDFFEIPHHLSLDLKDLAEIPFISFLQGSAMQNQLDDRFNRFGFKPRVTMELENIESIKALVRAGLGFAVLPLCSMTGPHGSQLRPLKIRRFRMSRDLALALPRSRVLPRSTFQLASRIARTLSGKSLMEIRDAIPRK